MNMLLRRFTFVSIVIFVLMNQVFAVSGRFDFNKSSNLITVKGETFRYVWDLNRGGEISIIEVDDGSGMLRVNSTAKTMGTVPHYAFIDENDQEFALSNCKDAEYELIYQKEDEVKFLTTGHACLKTGEQSPWIIEQTFRVFDVGVVFCDIDICLEPYSRFMLKKASITFPVDKEITDHKFRWTYDKAWPDPGMQHAIPHTFLSIKDSAHYKHDFYPYVGMNFGQGKDVQFSNHAEFVLENWKTMGVYLIDKKLNLKRELGETEAAGCSFKYIENQGMNYTWELYNGSTPVRMEPPYRYTNRWGIGVSATRNSSRKEAPFLRKNRVLGSIMYHWVNYHVGDARRGSKEWYPTNTRIDSMASFGCDILFLHNCWMRNGGSGRAYRGNYRIADVNEYKRVIDYCHEKGIKVGVYMRGWEYEQLDRDVSWFNDYLIKDFDGIYVDWTSFLYPPTPAYLEEFPIFGEKVTSYQPSRTHVPAFANFLYTRKLRNLVGENGFLVGHVGNKEKEPTTISMCYFDAVLIGEGHQLFVESPEYNIYYSGLVGNGCTIWGADALPKTRAKSSMPYYVAFDNNPKLVLGVKDAINLSPEYHYNYVLWKMYHELDEENLTVYNPATENKDIVSFSDSDFYGVVYKDIKGNILLTIGNFGNESECDIKLNFDTINAKGNYDVYEFKGFDYSSFTKKKIGQNRNGRLTIGPLRKLEYRGYLFLPD